MAAVALKDLGLPMTNDGYRYYDQITFGLANPPERPHPFPPDPPIITPPPELPESAIAALFAPPAGTAPPADPPLAPNYEWLIAVYPDKSSSWAQVGPHMTPSK